MGTKLIHNFALCSLTKLLKTSDLYRLGRALEVSARHCAKTWGLPVPTIEVIGNPARLPPEHCPLFFLDGSTDTTSGIGYHYFDPFLRRPAGRVFVGKTTGLNSGNSSVAELASHEIVEAMVDPRINQWRPHPQAGKSASIPLGTEMAEEIADMTQGHYLVPHGGTQWRMANFVSPAYFRASLTADDVREDFFLAGGFLDYARVLRQPGEIGPEGYATLRRRTETGAWKVWLANAKTDSLAFADELRESKSHPLSRSRRRQDDSIKIC